MLSKLKMWFNKEGSTKLVKPNDKIRFIVLADNIEVGSLESTEGKWVFRYTEEFKTHLNEYNLIVDFPDVNKTYESEVLWPFFQIRIPGLKQPAIQKILKQENIDQENEAALLKRFGYKTIANPYKLLVAG